MTSETKLRAWESVPLMPGWKATTTIQAGGWFYIDSMWTEESDSTFEILSVSLMHHEILQIPLHIFPFSSERLKVEFSRGVVKSGLLVMPPGCYLSFDFKNTGNVEGKLTISTRGVESVEPNLA